MRKKPNFWWDFYNNARYIVIESSNKKYPILVCWKIRGNSDTLIKKAEKIIEDLESGRTTIRGLNTSLTPLAL